MPPLGDMIRFRRHAWIVMVEIGWCPDGSSNIGVCPLNMYRSLQFLVHILGPETSVDGRPH